MNIHPFCNKDFIKYNHLLFISCSYCRSLSVGCVSSFINSIVSLFSSQVTLSRAMGALSIWQKMKLAWHLITTKDPIRYSVLQLRFIFRLNLFPSGSFFCNLGEYFHSLLL